MEDSKWVIHLRWNLTVRELRRDVVVVTVNYRLNVFGFLSHPEITAESPEAPTNFGHLDQQAGIHWVKRNIAAFGGDPDNITIGGQSAGGGSVLSQLASPQNEGLFQRLLSKVELLLCFTKGSVSLAPGPISWKQKRKESNF